MGLMEIVFRVETSHHGAASQRGYDFCSSKISLYVLIFKLSPLICLILFQNNKSSWLENWEPLLWVVFAMRARKTGL